MHRAFALALTSAAFIACSSDLCSQEYAYTLRTATVEAACTFPADSGLTFYLDAGTPEATWVSACETATKSCSATDLSTLSRELTCVQSLPAFQCDWITEELTGTYQHDDSLALYAAEGEVCTENAEDAGAISAACTAASQGLPPLPSVGSSLLAQNTTNAWPGTYTIDATTASFVDDGDFNLAAPSGSEVLTLTGTSLGWTDFASPAIPSCDLTLTLASATSLVASLASQSCSGWTLQSGEALLEGGTVSVNATGTDPDGGPFSLDYSLTP